MAGVLNKTARQFNLKCIDTRKGHEGRRVLVRLAPGFNAVDDEHWGAFKNDEYVKELKKTNQIDFGTKLDDRELEEDAPVKTKSKSEKVVTKEKK